MDSETITEGRRGKEGEDFQFVFWMDYRRVNVRLKRRELVVEEVKNSRRGARRTNDRVKILMGLEKKGGAVIVRKREGYWFGQAKDV